MPTPVGSGGVGFVDSTVATELVMEARLTSQLVPVKPIAESELKRIQKVHFMWFYLDQTFKDRCQVLKNIPLHGWRLVFRSLLCAGWCIGWPVKRRRVIQ